MEHGLSEMGSVHGVGPCGKERKKRARVDGRQQRPREAAYQASSEALLYKGPGEGRSLLNL